VRSARAWALLAGREYLLPEDVKAVLPAVCAHRLSGAGDDGKDAAAQIGDDILCAVPVP
jgi:MoxR-like ATPase